MNTKILHVTFRVGNADYAVRASDVLHLESFDEATHVPGAPSYVAGLVQTRGRLIPVIDLRTRFGLPPIEHSLDRRIVVVQVGTRVAGLLADSAREVVRLDEAAFEKPPEALEHQTAGFVKAVATVVKRLFLLVDVPRVIGEEVSHG
jgi:purine-binding chemotaxis protein CheW